MKNKKILVVGMGKSGMAAVRVLAEEGAEVSVQDSQPDEFIDKDFMSYLNKNNIRKYFACTPDDMGVYDMLVLSPGVPPYLGFINEAREKGIEIIGELELGYRLGRGHYIAITGTNGKTTTTTLTGEIYKAAGKDTFVVGNIGVPVVSVAKETDESSWLVTEVSSFQLETIKEFRAEVSAILNLTPDHLNRYNTMENYGKAKARIFMNQTEDQFCVLNYDDKLCYDLASANSCCATVVPFSRKEKLDFGAFVKDGNIVIKDKTGRETVICGADELLIPGTHNLENALAAAAISYFGGIDPAVIGNVLKTFKGVEHRIELCGEIDGVRFVNDSKGTNPDAAIKAIEAMKENIILIAGGYDKGSEFDEFVNAFGDRVKHLVLLGVTAPKIKEAAERAGFMNVTLAKDMEECVDKAFEIAEPGDVILLSPACASWDMYSCFEERGEHFKQCMQKLK